MSDQPAWLSQAPEQVSFYQIIFFSQENVNVMIGINELTALAVTSELAPTAKRGKYVALLVFTILPFTPAVLWAQLIASHAGWRYCGALCGAWAAVGFIMTAFFYFPPPRANSLGLTRRQVLGQIDYIGGLLSISGMILFMAGE